MIALQIAEKQLILAQQETSLLPALQKTTLPVLTALPVLQVLQQTT